MIYKLEIQQGTSIENPANLRFCTNASVSLIKLNNLDKAVDVAENSSMFKNKGLNNFIPFFFFLQQFYIFSIYSDLLQLICRSFFVQSR